MKKKVLLSSAVFVMILAATLGWQQRSEAIPASTQFDVRVLAAVWENFNTTRDKTSFVSTGQVVVGHEKAFVKIDDITSGADSISFDLGTLESTYTGNLYLGEGLVFVNVGGNSYTIYTKVVLRLQQLRNRTWVTTVFIHGGHHQTMLRVRIRGVGQVGAAL
ncbi:MAG: hypothetical protein IT445_16885 [Phycisphaeraceae bacterium]|nr:hypothetical protein [Phycisphaeraceae bacterium]